MYWLMITVPVNPRRGRGVGKGRVDEWKRKDREPEGCGAGTDEGKEGPQGPQHYIMRVLCWCFLYI
jgi:hypothetical protein